jgi:hypothetical protein
MAGEQKWIHPDEVDLTFKIIVTLSCDHNKTSQNLGHGTGSFRAIHGWKITLPWSEKASKADRASVDGSEKISRVDASGDRKE